MLFYSDYSYDASWSVRCALAEHHDDCVENNPNWQEYILSFSGCYDVPITQYTPNTYNYISMLSGMDERFVTSVRLSFQNNQPNNDRHIALAQEATHNSAKWEIVLGGWRGRQSVIRSGNQGTNLVAVQHSVNDFHNWASEIDVRFGDGYIQVWSLSNDLEIIAYNSNDIQQSEMREFMVSSGWGASGDWTITGVSCGNAFTQITHSSCSANALYPLVNTRGYANIGEAEAACEADLLCGGFQDRNCNGQRDGDDDFFLCPVMDEWNNSSSSCVYEKHHDY